MSQTNNRQRAVDAVNYLIAAPNYAALIADIRGILAKWDQFPMTYGGQVVFLNALIDIGLTDMSAFERLVKLIEEKRKLIPEARVLDYQRGYMAERRLRLTKAMELHVLQKGKFPNAKARKAAESAIQARWMAARDEYVEAKGELSWADRNAARGEFWATIDRTLDANLDAERARAGRPVSRMLVEPPATRKPRGPATARKAG